MTDAAALQSFLLANPDADLAAAQAAAVVRTPRATFVTYQTIANVWDQATAATFIARVKGGAKAGDPLATFVDALLVSGFDPANGKAAAVAAQLVAAGLCTAEQSDAVLNLTAHPFGDVPTADDVAAAREAIAAADARAVVLAAAEARVNAVVTRGAYAAKVVRDHLDALHRGETPEPPTDDEILAAFVAGGER